MNNAGLNSKRPVAIVVDTDPLTRWALAHYLGRWIEVRTANSLTEARTLLKELAPAAVIVGDEFPDGRGDELAGEVHALRPAARLVRISVEGSPGEVAEDAQTTHVTRLEKPFALSEIATLIGIDVR